MRQPSLSSLALFISVLVVFMLANAEEGTAPIPNEATPEVVETPRPQPASAPDDVLERFIIGRTAGQSGRIAFSAEVQGRYRLFILDLDAGKVRSLVWGPGANWYPAWSPDGTQVAFVSNRDGNSELYLADWEGMTVRRLTTNDSDDDHPAFSPDGKSIVFTMSPPGDLRGKKGNLAIVSLDGSAPVKLTTFKGRNSTPSWASNGQKISFTTDRFWPGWDVCLFDLSTKTEECILRGRDTYCRAAFSHDSKRLAYSFGFLNSIDLGVLAFAEGRPNAVVTGDGKEYDAVWSPDDKHIAFSISDGKPGEYAIGLVEVETGKERTLLTAPYPIRYLSWSKETTMKLEADRLKSELASPNELASPAGSPPPQ